MFYMKEFAGYMNIKKVYNKLIYFSEAEKTLSCYFITNEFL